MLKYLAPTLTLLLVACQTTPEEQSIALTGSEIIEKSINHHDPNGEWGNLSFSIHIQEPRLGNPGRFSEVSLDNRDGSFELVRNRGPHLSRHMVDGEGNVHVLLDDQEVVNEDTIAKYRLDENRVMLYRNSYQFRFGLPMTLADETIKEIGAVTISMYNEHECYTIPIELVEEQFSKHWILYIDTTDFVFKGMEIVHPGDATRGERLYFDGTFEVNGITIPRHRHWHEFSDDSYSGSDIIVKEIQ